MGVICDRFLIPGESGTIADSVFFLGRPEEGETNRTKQEIKSRKPTRERKLLGGQGGSAWA